MQSQTLKLIALISLFGICVLLLIIHLLSNKRRRFSIKAKDNRNRRKDVLAIYKLLIGIPIIKQYMQSIRARLMITTDYDEGIIIKQTVNIFMTAFAITIFGFVTCAFLIRAWYVWLVFLITLYFIFETIIDFSITKIKNRLLEQMVTFIDYLRNAYFETQMIDEAFIRAVDALDRQNHHDIKRQGEMIYDVLVAADSEVQLQTYYQMAPTPYLKLLAGLSYIVKEYGDSTVGEASAFIKSLSHLSSEIKDDIIKRTKLSIGLKSMNFIAFAPLLVMHPLKNWASDSFYPLKQFYAGAWGFFVEISLLLIILFSYNVLRRIQQGEEEFNQHTETYRIERYMYGRFGFIIKPFLPSPESQAYKKLKNRQIKAHKYIKMEWHIIQKILFAISLAMIGTVVVFLSIRIEHSNIYCAPTIPDGFLAGELKGEALELAEELTRFDTVVLKAMTSDFSSDTLSKYLFDTYNLEGEKLKQAINRIMIKRHRLDISTFTWLHIIIIYTLILIGWWLPELFLFIKQRVIKSDLEIEISRFQLVIMMLMHIDTLTVDAVLEWLEKFSFVLKVPIQKALMDYDAGAKAALKTLKMATTNRDFQTIVDHLITCATSLAIQEAFDEFESEKLYYQDKRRLANERVVNKKILWGQIIGFIPTYALMILYFMFPLIYASINEMQTYFEKLSF